MTKVCTDKKKSLHGVVLIMVVTVMMVLIVLLLATMAAVSTAQNRYYSKYEENQAYFSARSALDVCIDNAFIDSEYYAVDSSGAVRMYYYTDSSGAVQSEQMKQGLAIQLDTYRIKAHADTMENYEAMADKTQFSTDFWANAGANGDAVFTADPEKSYYEEPDLEYIEYKVQFPKLTSGSDNYGAMADNDPTDPTAQVATIRIEVIARTYDGHNKNLPAEMIANPGNATTLKNDDITSIRNGSRHKDTTYYKITSTVECQGMEQSASIIYSTPETSVLFTGAITATGGIDGIDNGVIIDGYASPGNVTLGNMGVYVGQSYVGGSVDVPAGGATVPMGKGQCTYFKEITNVVNNFYPVALGLTDTSPESDTPIIFVEADCTFSNQLIWAGGSTATRKDRVDLVVGGDMTAGGDLNFNGNILVGKDFYFSGNNINMASGTKIVVAGDLYVEGNLGSLNALRSASVYVGGNIHIGYNLLTDVPNTIYMQVGNTIENRSGSTAVAQAPVTGGSAIGTLVDFYDPTISYGSYFILEADMDGSGNVLFGFLDTSHNPTTEGSEIYIPTVDLKYSSSIGADVMRIINTTGLDAYRRYVPCPASKYYTCWKRSNVAPYSYIPDGSGRPDGYEFISAEEMAGTPKQADRDIGNYTAMSFTAPVGATTLPNSGTISVAGKTDYILTSGNLNLTFEGSGTANIYVSAGYYAGKIRSSDNTNINFYFQSANYTWNVANYTDSVLSAFGTGLRFGQNDPLRLPTPKIYFYASAGAVIDVNQAGWGLLTGYIYAPDANINTVKGLDGYSYTYYYDGDQIKRGDGSTMNSNPIIIGAVVCKNLHVEQNSAVCYIEPERMYEHGEPFFETTDNYYYARR